MLCIKQFVMYVIVAYLKMAASIGASGGYSEEIIQSQIQMFGAPANREHSGEC